MELFGIGLPELLLILLIALIVLGPEKLPEVASQLGKAMRELQAISKGFTEEYYKELAATNEPKRSQSAKPAPSPKEENTDDQGNGDGKSEETEEETGSETDESPEGSEVESPSEGKPEVEE